MLTVASPGVLQPCALTLPCLPGPGGEAEGEGVGGRETVTSWGLGDQEGVMMGQSHWWGHGSY